MSLFNKFKIGDRVVVNIEDYKCFKKGKIIALFLNKNEYNYIVRFRIKNKTKNCYGTIDSVFLSESVLEGVDMLTLGGIVRINNEYDINYGRTGKILSIEKYNGIDEDIIMLEIEDQVEYYNEFDIELVEK